jgi:hypothetical protein
MDRSSSLHERIADALNRAARAQEESSELIEQCRATSGMLRASLDAMHRRREARAAADEAFGNGQRDARMRRRQG